MKIYKATIKVTQEFCDKWNALLSISSIEEDGTEVFLRERGYDEDCTFGVLTAEFDNGWFADLKLCACQSNFFCDPVLFDDDGDERCVMDCFDSINIGDEFEFESHGDKYFVTLSA